MQSLQPNGSGYDPDEDAAVGGAPIINGADEPRMLDIEIDPPVDGPNGRTYTTLHLEEPTAQMIERAEAELAGNMSVHAMRKYQIALVSQGAKVPRAVIEKMRISQVKQAADFLSQFIAGGPLTGEN